MAAMSVLKSDAVRAPITPPASAPANAHAARLAAAGSAGHPFAAELLGTHGVPSGRDLDDCVHLLASIYGRQPSPIDLALLRAPAGPVRSWLSGAADAFERERLFLLRLSALVGPAPSTPGHAETEAAMLAQRHALETLAQSERQGCALGTATALVSDWRAIRSMLDQAARRVGCDVPPGALPDETSIADVIGAASTSASTDRAIRFGAEQLLLQHRAFFDLLEARADAREGF
ncbi:hypothetical protein M8312_05835 [Sphingomonas sp. KRR8]|uniref:DUF6975 family protein n=1 Tax=Sphingomonas sp. KRR8 TaxID=2942996 RepID=UPI002021B75D|nr:hypothetical protein [Sphingomonas sp. KRR8]URD62027.1 hypothetical protein M8312_05835 [Sphingomonas sp. KRR8]